MQCVDVPQHSSSMCAWQSLHADAGGMQLGRHAGGVSRAARMVLRRVGVNAHHAIMRVCQLQRTERFTHLPHLHHLCYMHLGRRMNVCIHTHVLIVPMQERWLQPAHAHRVHA